MSRGRMKASMRRRLGAGLLALAALTLAGCGKKTETAAGPAAQAKNAIGWKMMSLWGAGTLPQKLNEQFAERVKVMSGGRLLIEALPGGSIVAPTESLALGVTGGLIGLILALWASDAIVAALGTDAPYWITFGIDARVRRELQAHAAGAGRRPAAGPRPPGAWRARPSGRRDRCSRPVSAGRSPAG